MQEDTIENFCVIQFTSVMKPNIPGKSVLILTKAPKVLYKDIKTKIGCPKDYEANVKDNFKQVSSNKISVEIPQDILRRHFPINSPEPSPK